MQIRYKASGEVEHVSQEVGKFAVKAGLAVEILPTPKPERIVVTNWAALEGSHIGIDFQHEPYIRWSCGQCGQTTCVTKVSDKFVARHCGQVVEIPSHVRQEYNRLVAAYKARSRKKAPSPIAFVTSTALSDRVADQRILGHFGIKTKEQLVLQMQSDAELARRAAKK